MSFLRLESLSKTYPDGTEAVRGVDLSCEAGELIVLLGPSGCGKTTTLRMVAGLETPSAGRILLEGADMAPWPPQRRDVGFVFQFYALYPHLTVRENVAFPLRIGSFLRTHRCSESRLWRSDWASQLYWIAIPANSPEVTSSGYLWRVL